MYRTSAERSMSNLQKWIKIAADEKNIPAKAGLLKNNVLPAAISASQFYFGLAVMQQCGIK